MNIFSLIDKVSKFIEEYEVFIEEIVKFVEKVKKPGMNKKDFAVKLIKTLLDEKVYNVPDFLDGIEEELIGIAVDLVVKKLNLQGKL